MFPAAARAPGAHAFSRHLSREGSRLGRVCRPQWLHQACRKGFGRGVSRLRKQRLGDKGRRRQGVPERNRRPLVEAPDQRGCLPGTAPGQGASRDRGSVRRSRGRQGQRVREPACMDAQPQGRGRRTAVERRTVPGRRATAQGLRTGADEPACHCELGFRYGKRPRSRARRRRGSGLRRFDCREEADVRRARCRRPRACGGPVRCVLPAQRTV